jgi:hypothetical protein
MILRKTLIHKNVVFVNLRDISLHVNDVFTNLGDAKSGGS